MEKVSKEKFEEVIQGRRYKTSFLLDEKNTLRYNGIKGIFKDYCFAKKVSKKGQEEEYYVDEIFIK
jgi:hypothetical protein